MVDYLESKLSADVEGTCSGKFGYIISVLNVIDVGKGIVLPGNGQAEFVARYRAIVFKPFKGEVLDGVVGEVNKVGSCGLSFRASVNFICLPFNHRWDSLLKSAPSMCSCQTM